MADKRKVEAGREKLAAYVKKKNATPPKRGRRTKMDTLVTEEMTESNTTSTAVDSDISSSTASDSMNSFGDGKDVERLTTRVKELEEILAGKDTALAAMREELITSRDISVDISTGSLSFGLEADYKAHLERYQTRLEEFKSAVAQRDDLIVQLSDGLKNAKRSHEAREETTAQGIALLERQLQAATKMVQGYSWETGIAPHEFLAVQSKMLALEDQVAQNKTVINEMNTAIQAKDSVLRTNERELLALREDANRNQALIEQLNAAARSTEKEFEQKVQELNAHKAQAAKEVQELMREVETLNQRSILSTSNVSLDETALRCQLEEDFGLQLAQIKNELRNQLTLEYEAKLTLYKAEATSVKTSESVALEDNLTTELASYEVELALLREQTEDLKKKLENVSQELVASKQSHHAELTTYKQRVDNLNAELKETTTLRSQVESLTKSLLVAKESAAKELRQCQQSHIKELDLIKSQNTALEIDVDNLTLNENNCRAELNACKEAFIAQFGINKHSVQSETIALRQEIGSLKVQLAETQTHVVKSVPEIESRKETIEQEIKALSDAKMNSLNETIEQLSCQVKQALNVQENLTRANGEYLSEIETYKGLLSERSKVEEGHGRDVLALSKELAAYKERIELIEEKHSRVIAEVNDAHDKQVSSLNEEISAFASSRDESLSELILARDEIQSLKKSLDEVVIDRENLARELLTKRTENDDYKSRLNEANVKHQREIEERAILEERCEKESTTYKELLDEENMKHQAKLVEMQENFDCASSKLHDHVTEMDRFKERILGLNKIMCTNLETDLIGDVETLINNLESRVVNLLESSKSRDAEVTLITQQFAVAQKQYVEELKVANKEIHELSKDLSRDLLIEPLEDIPEVEYEESYPVLKEKIGHLKQLLKARDEQYGTINSQLLETVVKVSSMQAMLRGKEEVEQSIDRDLANESFNSIKDIEELLERRVKDLEASLIEATKESNALHEVKLSLERQTRKLESLLELSVQERQTLTEKVLAAETLVSSKNELEKSLKKRIQELDVALRERNVTANVARVETIQKEGIEVTLRKRIEELEASLRQVNVDSESMREESDRMTTQVAKAKELLRRSKAERDELCRHHESEMAELRGRTKSDKLEHLVGELDRLEKEHDGLVARCNVYEAEVTQLRSQLVNSETSLEDLRQELSNNRAPVSDNRRENGSLGFMGNSFFNENNNSSLMNMSEYLDIAGFNANNAVKLIENCNQLENARHDLEENVENLRLRLREKEVSEEFLKEAAAAREKRCAELESSLTALRVTLASNEKNKLLNGELAGKVTELERELKSNRDVQEKLREELLKARMSHEEGISKTLRAELSESFVGNRTVEEVIVELGGKAKEVVVLTEKVRLMEATEEALRDSIRVTEEGNARLLSQLAFVSDEATQLRTQLDSALLGEREANDRLAGVRQELAFARLGSERLAHCVERLEQERGDSGALEAAKLSLLTSALTPGASSDPAPSPTPVDQDVLTDSSLVDLCDRLERIFQSRPVVGQLSTELAFYREQHASLAEAFGTKGILQGALSRQKAELGRKMEEKRCVEAELERKRSTLANTELRLRLAEQRVSERDMQCVELNRQRRLAEEDLREIEQRLAEQEQRLLGERQRLAADVRERDGRIRHWQAQCRAKQLELTRCQTSAQLTPLPLTPSPAQLRLAEVRRDLDSAHQQAVLRLRAHLEQVFSTREVELAAGYGGRLASMQEDHRAQLANVRRELDSRLRELEALKQCEEKREDFDVDLDEMKIKLDESQKEIYSELRKKFEAFAEHRVNSAIARIQSEHELAMSCQTTLHKQELDALRAKMEQRKLDELLKVKQELLQQREQDLADVSSPMQRVSPTSPSDAKSAVHLLKQLLCHEFTRSYKMLCDARYEKYSVRLQELTTRVEAKMEEDGQNEASISSVEQLLAQQEELVNQTQALVDSVLTDHARLLETLVERLDDGHAQLLRFLDQTKRSVEAAVHIAALEKTVATLEGKVTALQDEKLHTAEEHSVTVERLSNEARDVTARLDQLLASSDLECGPCHLLRRELETRHGREVEELRQYFEQKCADVEKHYSEEIFSQHSRKLSTGSSSCENELVSDLYFPGAEHTTRVNTLTHVCDVNEPTYKEVEAECRRSYELRLSEYRDQLEVVRRELEERYSSEMQALKVEYEARVEGLVRDLAAGHQAELDKVKQALESDLECRHRAELEAMRSDYERRLSDELDSLTDRMLSDERDHIERVRSEMRDAHRAEIEAERQHVSDQVDEYTRAVKIGAEQEQDKFSKVQKEMMSGFLLQHKEDLRLITEQYEAQLVAARQEIAKLTNEHAEYDKLITQSKRRLQAEVQHDVLRALDEQLQALLTDERDTSSCPAELLQLQDRFSARYKRELAALNQELAALKRELAELRREEPSTAVVVVPNESAVEPTRVDEPAGKERAELRQMACTMKSLVSELAKYVSVCEDELNSSIVDQLLAYEAAPSDSDDLPEPSFFRDAQQSLSVSNGDIPYMSIVSNLDVSSGNKTSGGSTSNDLTMDSSEREPSLSETPSHKSAASRKTRRVRFAPDLSRVLSLDADALIDYVERDKRLPDDFSDQLDSCLERLREEAAAIVEDKVDPQVSALQKYRAECERLTALVTALTRELSTLRAHRLEAGREEVTEGYGEREARPAGGGEGLAELQEQARCLVSEGGVAAPHVHLIEELCREGDRLVEESKRDREDLQLQVCLETPSTIVHRVCCLKVAAADKQLRSTRQFLEEQAVEREQERDDFLHEITRLKDQLKANDAGRLDLQRLNKEVETLEVQVKEATSLLREAETKKEELEAELKAAVDKVWVLRDIISELESQVEIKSQNEATLEQQLHELQALLQMQSQNNQELTNQLDCGQSEMTEHISQLEEQLRSQREHMEQFQPDSVMQMKSTLREFETTLDRKTKDLESLYTHNNSSASSPCVSEDVSIREQVDAMRSATPDEAAPSLPLAQLLRLQDKLEVHSRAEQAALKRIRDLEMQLNTVRYDEQEVVAERDVLQTQVQEQLLKISLLQSNVEEQRSKADNIILQASSDLQKQLHDRQLEARDLKQAVENKDKQVKDVQVVLEQTRQAVAAQEAEWTARVTKEQEAVHKLKLEYRKLKEQLKCEQKKSKAEKERQPTEDGAMGRYVPVTALIDSLQATKVAQIEALTQQVKDLEARLRCYEQLDLTPEQRAKLNGLLKTVDANKKALEAQKAAATPLGVGSPGRSIDSQGPLVDASRSSLIARGISVDSEGRMVDSEGRIVDSQGRFVDEEGRTVDADGNLVESVSGMLDAHGRLVDSAGRLVDAQGRLVDAQGRLVDAQGRVVDSLGRPVDSTEVLYQRPGGTGPDETGSGPESDMSETDLRGLLHQKESMIVSLRNQLAERMVKGLSSLRLDIDRKDARINQLTAQLTDLPNLMAEIKALKEQIRNAIVDVAKEQDQVSRSESTMRSDISAVEAELQKERQLTKALKDELNALKGAGGDGDGQLGIRGSGFGSAQLDEICRKILDVGFDLLTFEELSYLHERCCSQTGRMIMENPNLNLTPMTLTLANAGKEELCGRIASLEQEIARRQFETQKKLVALENSVRHERKRLHEVKETLGNSLGQEQRRSLELHARLGSQVQQHAELESERDMIKRQLAYHEEKAKSAIQQLEKEKSKNRIMEEDLHKERNSIKHLQSLLEAERSRAKNSNIKESDLIETLRIKLDTALDNEAKMRFKYEKLEGMQQSMSVPTNQSPRRGSCAVACPATCNSPEPHSAYHDLQSKLDKERENADSMELALRREQRRAEQMQASHDKEKKQTLHRIEAEREKNKKLRRQLAAAEEEKESLHVQIDNNRETLSERQLLYENLEQKIVDLQESYERRRRRWLDEEEKNRLSLEKAVAAQSASEQKASDLQREVSALREQLSECFDSGVVAELRTQLVLSREREQELLVEIADMPKEPNISTPLLNKLKRMNLILEKHVEENSEVAVAMTQLNLDRQRLRERVAELEAALADRPDRSEDDDPMEVINGLLATERATWAREKAALLNSLAQTESVKRSTDTSDAQRVRHLFGKYLRVESYRKALVWQKRYLLVVISGYQHAENQTVDRLERIANVGKAVNGVEETNGNASEENPAVNKFRCCVKAIIAIHRMQFLVRRWRHSRSIGGTTVLNRGSVESIVSGQSSYYGPRKSVVSSLWSVSRGLEPTSPNSKEPYRYASRPREQHMLRRWEEEEPRKSDNSSVTQPMKMDEYIDRFDQIQQKLGLAVAHRTT